VSPRVFGIPATEAPIVAVIRRGPSGWCHVGRWDTERDEFSPGSWLRGHIYAQRCDLSPDGRWLAWFAYQGRARWEAGPTYLAVSRLPWLTALVAWPTDGTWARGLHFVERGQGAFDAEPAAVGDPAPLLARYGLDVTRAATFAVERRRGWTETDETPVRGDDDPWDEVRADHVTMAKPRPGDGATRLLVRGRYAAFRDMQPSRGRPAYAVARAAPAGEPAGPTIELAGVQWADWDRLGRLLVATVDGELQVRQDPAHAGSIVWRSDLGALRPAPSAPPAEASQW
jgi:hypothetical protein